MPFGGMKMSGIGRESFEDSRKFFTEAKTVCITYQNKKINVWKQEKSNIYKLNTIDKDNTTYRNICKLLQYRKSVNSILSS